MSREFLHAKLHNVKITQVNKEYQGSITIDQNWLDKSGIMPYEKVIVADVENGARFTTYTISGERGSGVIGVNGSAANLVNNGDRVIIMAFKSLEDKDLKSHVITTVLFNQKNEVEKILTAFPFEA